jgi:hypothetical protein
VLDYPAWQETAEQTATALLKPSALRTLRRTRWVLVRNRA